ncbi:type VII secretion-associated serine protease mycosin, partial [Streptomyces sp. 7-21]|nr:type VII secretion-associated serine protease mycosin [Streptomyces sp. 7-21]
MTPPRHTRTAATLLAALLTVPLTATAHAQEDDVQHPWYFDTYRAEDIWQHTTGEGITVAVIDTGVDPTLPELEGQVLEGTDL